jgi:hypothetical protein
MSPLGKAIEFKGAAPRLRLPPGIQQAGVLHLIAQLFHAHVRHLQPVGEFSRVQPLGSLEFIENFQARTAGDGFEKTLFQGFIGLKFRGDRLGDARTLPPHPAR